MAAPRYPLVGLLLVLLVAAVTAFASGVSDSKKSALLWYEAFASHKPEILDTILAPEWVDIPSAPDAAHGPEGARRAMHMLVSTFPDFNIVVDDVIAEGNKVVVRSTITGTQALAFADIPTRQRPLKIQAVDIHEIKDGKIIRTWHTEDWMTGLRQLGAFDR